MLPTQIQAVRNQMSTGLWSSRKLRRYAPTPRLSRKVHAYCAPRRHSPCNPDDDFLVGINTKPPAGLRAVFPERSLRSVTKESPEAMNDIDSIACRGYSSNARNRESMTKPQNIGSISLTYSCVLAALRHGDFLPGVFGAYRSEKPRPNDTSIAGRLLGLRA